MLNTLRIFHELEETLDRRSAEKITDIIGRVYEDLQNTVTKTEFHELTEIVRDLGKSQKELTKAQKRTESRMEELAEAQKRTESRMEELAEAQKRTEIRMEELTEAQKELAEAQKRTEIRMEELVEAQAKTETTVEALARKLDTTIQMVSGLSDAVGYGLEDRAYQALPRLLKQDFEIDVAEPLYRRYLYDLAGNPIEVNIFGAASRSGQPVHVIGESKSQLSRRKIDEFCRKKLKLLEGKYPALFPILITYMIVEPDVEEYAKAQGIHLYYSYQFPGDV